jgi:hypothetical protein
MSHTPFSNEKEQKKLEPPKAARKIMSIARSIEKNVVYKQRLPYPIFLH